MGVINISFKHRILYSILLFFIIVSIIPVCFATDPHYWTEVQPAGSTNQNWRSSSMSTNGNIILAGVYDGRLYLSTNRGSNWSEVQPAGSTNQDWRSSSVSDDGNIILAGAYGGRLYLSTNSGSSWSEVQPAGATNQNWWTSSMSDDGNIILAGVSNGRLYLSTNRGSSWSEVQPAGATNQKWFINSMSSDGNIILAGVYGGRLYLSTNRGSSWSEVQPAGSTNQNWRSSSMSDDGSIILAGVYGGRLYLSTNRGSNWSEVQPAGATNQYWVTSSMSDDGSIILAGVDGGRLYLSTNRGSSWSEVQPAGATNLSWRSSSMSGNGSIILAGVYGGRLYLSAPLNFPVSDHNSGIYSSPFYVTLTNDSNADIYYTLDGSTPDNTKTKYTTPILINNPTTTLKAISWYSSTLQSNVVTYDYSIIPDNPVADHNSGTYLDPFYVTLTNDSNADIYYTLDGSTPDNTKTKYTTPIYINEIKTLKAISWYSSISKSNVVTYNYSITESHNGCFINVTCRTGTIHKGDILYQKIQNSNNQEYCYLNGLTTENSSNGIIEIELITGGTGKNGITQNFIIDNNFLSNVGTIYFFIDEKTSPIYINCYDILPHIDNNYTILYNVKLKQLDQFTFSYDTKPVIANRTYTNIPVNTDDWLLLGIVIFMLSIGCLIIINICIKVYSKNKKA